MIGQTDAKGQVFAFDYDSLGRLTTRLADGGAGMIVDEWDYDEPAAGLLERTRRLSFITHMAPFRFRPKGATGFSG